MTFGTLKKIQAILDNGKEIGVYFDLRNYGDGWDKFNTIDESTSFEEVDAFLENPDLHFFLVDGDFTDWDNEIFFDR